LKYLIDTHLLIWAANDTLPKEALPYFLNKDNKLFFSSASIWEVVIKNGLNHPDFQINPDVLYCGLLDNDYTELSITSIHSLLVAHLKSIHKDPFDRILIAQAKSEGMILLSSDEIVSQYPNVIYIKGL